MLFAATAILVLLVACGHTKREGTPQALQHTSPSPEIMAKDIDIINRWQGDFPIAHMEQLPDDQRDNSVGYLGDAIGFEKVWLAFQPDEPVPDVNFEKNLVLFVRNKHFYNRISIGKVTLQDGVVDLLTLQTLSAIPIEDKLAMALVVVSRQGIASIRSPEGQVVIDPSTPLRTFFFECNGKNQFVARVEGSRACLFLPAETVCLPLFSRGPGERFGNERVIFWMKDGNRADLKINDEAPWECQNNRSKAVWEDAKFRGVAFRANGNEPGWTLEITPGQNILFVGDYGQTVLEFDTPDPLENQRTHTTTYMTRNADHSLEVIVNDRPCQDTMSGERFESTVILRLDSKEYGGCGKGLY